MFLQTRRGPAIRRATFNADVTFDRTSSTRRIVASTAVLGASTLVGVVLATLRMKLAAMVLGALGVGLVGLLQNVMVTASGFLGLGLGQAAPRQLAQAAASGPSDEGAARMALAVTTGVAALVCTAVIAVFAKPIAHYVYADASLAQAIGWTSIG